MLSKVTGVSLRTGKRDITVDDLLRRREGLSNAYGRPMKRRKVEYVLDEKIGSDEEDQDGLESFGEEEEDNVGDESEDEGSVDEDEEQEEEDNRKEKPSSFAVEDRLGSFVKKKSEPVDALPRKPKESSVKSFTSFDISKALVAALTSMSIKVPTPVQAACIPPLLQGAWIAKLNLSR